jgi:hypothetical protein
MWVKMSVSQHFIGGRENDLSIAMQVEQQVGRCIGVHLLAETPRLDPNCPPLDDARWTVVRAYGINKRCRCFDDLGHDFVETKYLQIPNTPANS